LVGTSAAQTTAFSNWRSRHRRLEPRTCRSYGRRSTAVSGRLP